jgi:hypothetical protein
MKLVGKKDRHEIELDPEKAWKRGRELDALLKSTSPPYPRGIWRLTHSQMNQIDLERQVAQFTRVNNG